MTQYWYADDLSAQGKFDDLLKWWIQLNEEYYPEGRKSYLIVSNDDKENAKKIFHDTGIQIVTGSRFLGSYIGSFNEKNIFVKEKI